MKTIIFNKDITPENVQWLCDEINANLMDNIIIYLSSEKGTQEGEDLFVDYIESLLNHNSTLADSIIIKAFGKLHIHAFNVFFRVDLPKTVVKNTQALIIADPNDDDYMKWLAKIHLTKTIMNRIKKGKPEIFNHIQLIEILFTSGKVLKHKNG